MHHEKNYYLRKRWHRSTLLWLWHLPDHHCQWWALKIDVYELSLDLISSTRHVVTFRSFSITAQASCRFRTTDFFWETFHCNFIYSHDFYQRYAERLLNWGLMSNRWWLRYLKIIILCEDDINWLLGSYKIGFS